MRTILTFFIVSLPAVAPVAFGCGSGGGGAEPATSVVATTAQAADLARHVVGDRGRVTAILDASADPHEYEPRPSDAEALADADLIVRSGGEVDAWLDQLLDSSGSDAPVLTLSDHIKPIVGEDGADPHWWQDPRNAVLAVAAVRDELDVIDPGGATTFDAGARRYTAELDRLDARIAACMRKVSPAERRLVTSHDALGYYARRYGIEVIGAALPALTTAAQASAGETAELIDRIRTAGVRAVFPEAGVSPDLERAIAAEAGAEIGGELWADTLGPEGSDAADYVGSLKANTDQLIAGFTGGRSSCFGD